MTKRMAIYRLGILGTVVLTTWTSVLPAGVGQAAPLPVYENAAAYSNLNAAVAAALAKGVGGVRIPAGTTIAARGPIYLPSGFAVVGENSATSLIVLETIEPAGFLLAGVTGIVMRGFTLDGSSVDQAGVHSGSGFGVLINGTCGLVTLEDCVFVKIPSAAIYQHSLPTATLRVARCRFLDGGNFSVWGGVGGRWVIMNNEFRRTGGINIGGEGHIIMGNVFDDLTYIAVQTAGLSRSLVAHNIVPRSTREYGVFQTKNAGPMDPNDGNVYAYNLIHNTGMVDGKEEQGTGSQSGFQTWSGGNNLVVGNLFYASAGYGICDSGNTMPLGNVCSDNVVSRIIDPGILVNISDMAVIRRSRICHVRSIGVHLGFEIHLPVRVPRGAHGCWLVNNVIRDNAIPGVWAKAMTEGLIQGNRILDNGRNSGIWASQGLQDPPGRAGLWVSWYPQLAGDNEFAFNRIVGNTIGDTRADPKQKTQYYGILVGEVRASVSDVKVGLDPNDKWSFRNNYICWNDLRGNREAAIHYIPGAMDRYQTIRHNATNEATAKELDRGPALADAGPSLVVAGGSTVRLTARHTRCPKGVDPTSLRYTWWKVGPEGRRDLWVTNTPSPSVTFPKGSGLEIYRFVLRVTRPDASDPKTNEYTEDTVLVATYDDEVCGPRLPATFDKELTSSAKGLEGFCAVAFTPTNGWQWAVRKGELAARLDGTNGGGVRLIPDGKIFGQVASVDMVSTNPLAAGMSAGLVLVNSTGADRLADGYFLGLHRGTGEAEATLKAIRFMGCKPVEFAGLAASDARILHQGCWDGKRLQLSVQRVGDVYTFLVNGIAVAKDTLSVLEEPYYDGPVPTLVALQVLTLIAAQAPAAVSAPAEIRFDNLAIDHAVSPPAMP